MDTERQPIELRLLGPIEASDRGHVIALGGPRMQALLALLLLDVGRSVPADRLVDELWSGEPPDGADVSLRTYISRLRTALGASGQIRKVGAGYAIHVSPGSIDLQRFEALVREGESALARRRARRARDTLGQALAMWRGRPFGDLAHSGSLRAEAERLEDLHLLAIELRIEADLELGATGAVVDELEALVVAQPYREGFWRQLMLALYRAERQADALSAYQRARRALDEQLGVEPGPRLEAMQSAILRHEVPLAAAAAPATNLPAPLSSFVGRATQLVEIARLLETSRLVTLTGVGGVGKTRVAMEAARGGLDNTPDGVTLVDLAPIADPELVVGRIATDLDLGDTAGTTPIERVERAIASREMLLVLDNCEHLRGVVAATAARLLASCAGLRILATSRQILGVPGEVAYPVPPLDVPSVGSSPDAARTSESVALFLARAREARPSLTTDDTTIEAIAGICADLDGLPLAIELAAARVRALAVSEIADRLRDRFQFLVSWRRLSSARHRTLREAMDWSYELLSPEEQVMLADLSVFAGSFTLDAAAVICCGGDESRALDLLEHLVEASVLAADLSSRPSRYRLLETVRQYAAARLAAFGQRDDVRRAHARYFTNLAESVQLRGPEQAHGQAIIERDIDNVRTALDAAGTLSEPGLELRLVSAVWRYWHVRGLLAEGRARLEDALARPGARHEAAFGSALLGAGYMAWTIGDYARGDALGRELLTRAQEAGSLADAHAGNNLLAHIALRRRDFEASERYARRTVELAGELGDEVQLAHDKFNYAVIFLDWGQVSRSIEMFEESLQEFRRLGLVEGVGFAVLNLGEAACRLGDFSSARDYFDTARAAFSSIGFRAHVGHALEGLAAVEARTGDPVVAARLLGSAHRILEEVGASKDEFAPWLVAGAESEAREAMGEAAFADAFAEGSHLGEPAQADPAEVLGATI